MPKDKIRVCVIGAGQMANKVHYPSLASFDDLEIVGISAFNPHHLRDTAQRFSIPPENCFQADHPTSYQKMIEKTQPDAVYAIGHPHVMIDPWIWCLQQHLHLFIEKPMGLNLHQAQSLAHLAQKHRCITQVGHQRRSCPLLVKMRDLCLQRGPINHAVCEFFKCEPDPFIGPRDHMFDDTVHAIDTVRWMCAGDIVDIHSHCRRIGTPDINYISATLYFDNGSVGSLVNSWTSGRRVFRVQMHAPKIYVDAEVENQATLYANGDYQGVTYHTADVAGSDQFHVFAGFEAKHREFVDAVKNNTHTTSSPFDDTLKTIHAAQTILAQNLLNP